MLILAIRVGPGETGAMSELLSRHRAVMPSWLPLYYDSPLEITSGKGVPVVYDSVGKDTLTGSLDCLQKRGALVSNGTSSGPVVIDTTLLAMKGSLWVTRPAMVDYALPRPNMLKMADELFDLVLKGQIVSEPKQSFALAEAAEAHRALESRQTVGATILLP